MIKLGKAAQKRINGKTAKIKVKLPHVNKTLARKQKFKNIAGKLPEKDSVDSLDAHWDRNRGQKIRDNNRQNFFRQKWSYLV